MRTLRSSTAMTTTEASSMSVEIAAIVGVSQMQVSRLVARGLKRMRESLGAPEPPVEQRRRKS